MRPAGRRPPEAGGRNLGGRPEGQKSAFWRPFSAPRAPSEFGWPPTAARARRAAPQPATARGRRAGSAERGCGAARRHLGGGDRCGGRPEGRRGGGRGASGEGGRRTASARRVAVAPPRPCRAGTRTAGRPKTSRSSYNLPLPRSYICASFTRWQSERSDEEGLLGGRGGPRAPAPIPGVARGRRRGRALARGELAPAQRVLGALEPGAAAVHRDGCDSPARAHVRSRRSRGAF